MLSKNSRSIGAILVGLLFLASAIPKLLDPFSFVQAVAAYELVSGVVLRWSALWVPWLELLVGLALVVGVWRREAFMVVIGLLSVFSAAMSLALLRGMDIDCGCFAFLGPLSKVTWWRVAINLAAIAVVWKLVQHQRDPVS